MHYVQVMLCTSISVCPSVFNFSSPTDRIENYYLCKIKLWIYMIRAVNGDDYKSLVFIPEKQIVS